MPGPNSQPVAVRDGRTYAGKTNLAKAGLKSGEGMSSRDWDHLGSLKQSKGKDSKPANSGKRRNNADE